MQYILVTTAKSKDQMQCCAALEVVFSSRLVVNPMSLHCQHVVCSAAYPRIHKTEHTFACLRKSGAVARVGCPPSLQPFP